MACHEAAAARKACVHSAASALARARSSIGYEADPRSHHAAGMSMMFTQAAVRALHAIAKVVDLLLATPLQMYGFALSVHERLLCNTSSCPKTLPAEASCCPYEPEDFKSSCLQRMFRGTAARRMVARLHSAAVAIQSAWRRRQAMRRYAQAVHDVIAVQVARTSASGHKRVNWM